MRAAKRRIFTLLEKYTVTTVWALFSWSERNKRSPQIYVFVARKYCKMFQGSLVAFESESLKWFHLQVCSLIWKLNVSIKKTHTDCKQINRKQSTKKKVLSRNFEGKFSRCMPNVYSGFCYGFAGGALYSLLFLQSETQRAILYWLLHSIQK